MLIIRKKEYSGNLHVGKHCKDTSKVLLETRKRFQKERLKFIGLCRPVAVSVPGMNASSMSRTAFYDIRLKKK